MKKRITRLWITMPVSAGWRLLLLVLLLSALQPAHAQTKPQVSGKVISAEGEALPGVSVVVKNTTTGTVTDPEGQYSLPLPDGAATLVFSFIGFSPQEVAVGNRSQVNVTLQVDAKALDEVVVVGYGTQKKENLTGSVSAISSEELTVVPVANTTTALAGKLPGLIAVQPSGEPGRDNANLSIRGFGNALVVVDGIVGRDFARLNPNEIESITILKDAASTAVYGVSGGNGVILVTTKKGLVGTRIMPVVFLRWSKLKE